MRGVASSSVSGGPACFSSISACSLVWSILAFFCSLPGVVGSIDGVYQHAVTPRRLQQQQVDACPFHPDVDGYQDINALQEDIDDGVTGDDFILCPGITYTQGLILTAMDETAPPLVIRCAEVEDLQETGPCDWQVEQASHIVFEPGSSSPSSLDVIVKGIAFSNSKESSIVIDASGDGAIMAIRFDDCTWTDNFGEAVVEITNSTSNSSPDALSSTVAVRLEGCVFDNNNVFEAILYTSNTAAELTAQNCDFIGNRGLSSIIILQDGAFGSMGGISMINNTVQTPGLIYVEGTARINETDICGSNNAVSGVSDFCNGTFLQIANPNNCQDPNDLGCAPACNSYDACDTTSGCISTVETLRQVLEDVGGSILLCSDTTFALGVDGFGLEIGAAAAAVSLTCQDINCIIEGGTEQLLILDGATDVLVEGVTFLASQESSIRIEIDPTEPAFVAFKDCEWSNHDGGNFLISATYALQAQEGDPLEAILQITNSHFKNNNVEEYLVENRVLRVAIENCTFETNAGLALVGALGGETIVKSTSLESNEATSALFFVGINSNGFTTEEVCGASNEAGVCNGTHFEATDAVTCRDDSSDIDACEEFCVPLLAACESTCYSTWEELDTAIGIASEGFTFQICENTRMELSESASAISILQPDTVLRCGNDGSILNDCTISGGSSHFVVNASSSFHGITFSGASTVSVQVFSDLVAESAKVEFKECYWNNNDGTDTFEILHSADLSSGVRRLQNDEQVYVVEISDSIFSVSIFGTLEIIFTHIQLTPRYRTI
jgi:hypothetical protein